MSTLHLLYIVLAVTIQHSRALSSERTGFKPPGEDRSTPDLVWGCLLTILTCSWTLVHLNVPAYNEKSWIQLVRKFGWMLLSIIFPEFLVIVSLSDWWLARLDIKMMHEHGYTNWTMTHAFFANMGGLVLENRDYGRTPLAGRPLLMLLRGNHIALPSLTKEDIEDKSKADQFVKVIVGVQIAWMLTQVSARLAQRLPISELELVTIIFILCTIVNHYFWWHKPLDVGRPYLLQCHNLSRDLLDQVIRSLPEDSLDAGRISDIMTLRMGDFLKDYGQGRWFKLIYRLLLGGFIGMIVGGLHCAAWNFSFPSPIEQKLWRICSLIATASLLSQGLMLLIFYGCHELLEKIGVKTDFMEEFGAILLLVLPMIVHVFARITLLVLVFVCLRSAPVELYYNVRWSALIPHFN
jgi:hypothetical protein